MSEATYNETPDPDPTPSKGDGSGGGTASAGGITIDTTYPRSIEGILKIVTVVSPLK